MNILPKKRWHVRTRENIARVRRDEAKAAEEEKQKQLRIEKAEREARTELLRKRARQHYKPETVKEDKRKTDKPNEHINLFYELEQDVVTDKQNEEYVKEKKLETEKYEKQIGYLTYLGQDTNEITGNVSWYNRDPGEKNHIQEEVAKDVKYLEDPLRDIRKYLGTEGIETVSQKVKAAEKSVDIVQVKIEKEGEPYSSAYNFSKKKKKSKLRKHKKKKKKNKKKHSSDSDSSNSSDCEEPIKKKPNVSLDILRAERLKREQEERKRAELLLQKLRGETIKEEKIDPEIEQKYNSQFNPHLAKQNVKK